MRRIARPRLPIAQACTALTLAILLSACAVGGQSPSPSDDDDLIAHPPGDELVFRVEYAGGFLMANAHLTSLPVFSMTGDGRVIVQGAQIDLFPGPALPAVQVRQLNEDGVQAVLAAVAASRQFAANVEWRGAQNFVADASDAVFTLHAGDRDVVVKVYGLGTLMDGQAMPGMPAAELAAHDALGTLMERLTSLDLWIPAASWVDAAWRPFEPQALRLVVRNADADPPDDTGIGNTEVEWPVAGDPATFGEPTTLPEFRCGVVSGEEAQTWYDALVPANQLTRWTGGGHKYEVTVRPLLPDEAEACPAA
jgi:hypothetical protein